MVIGIIKVQIDYVTGSSCVGEFKIDMSWDWDLIFGRSNTPPFMINILTQQFSTCRQLFKEKNKPARQWFHASFLLRTKASRVSRRKPFTSVVNSLSLFMGRLSLFHHGGCYFKPMKQVSRSLSGEMMAWNVRVFGELRAFNVSSAVLRTPHWTSCFSVLLFSSSFPLVAFVRRPAPRTTFSLFNPWKCRINVSSDIYNKTSAIPVTAGRDNGVASFSSRMMDKQQMKI